MADIFLSYTNLDLPRVRPLVAVFEEQGFSICQRGILVPATMDRLTNDDIPLEFSLIQSAMLVDWDGKSQNDELDSLVTSVAALVSRSPRGDVGAWRGRAKVFISYRRNDARASAGHLFDMLASEFGEDSIFMDLDSIQVGVDFTSVMDNALAQSAVVLALIGSRWVSTRLDDPDDLVRTQLAHALSADLPVIPVLVDDADMPREEDLPAELARLARVQPVTLRDVSWQRDIGQLTEAIQHYVEVAS
jgi:hypothetical protein